MTHDAYAELEQKMVQDAKLAHTPEYWVGAIVSRGSCQYYQST